MTNDDERTSGNCLRANLVGAVWGLKHEDK